MSLPLLLIGEGGIYIPFVLVTLRPHLRRAAALLASLALLAVPARGVLACDMAAMPSAAGISQPAEVSGEAGAHQHHHMDASATAASSADERGPRDGNPEAPALPHCDHLVGCSPIAFSTGAVLVATESEIAAPEPPSDTRAVDAPVRALEPPPPKR